MTEEESRKLLTEVSTMPMKEVEGMEPGKRALVFQACHHLNHLKSCTEDDLNDIENVKYLLHQTKKKNKRAA